MVKRWLFFRCCFVYMVVCVCVCVCVFLLLIPRYFFIFLPCFAWLGGWIWGGTGVIMSSIVLHGIF